MGREYAQIRLSMWNDDDYRDLTVAAQHLYKTLLTHPTITNAGVGDWRPTRIAALARDNTPQKVRDAAAELIDRLYIVVDEDTEEYLIRSFHRNDDLLKMPNMATAVARSAAEVASAGIRGVLVHELKRLKKDRADMKGWGSVELLGLLENPSVNPSVYPCGNPSRNPSGNPSINPSRNPSVKGSGNPSPNPSGNPSGNPSVMGEGMGSGNPSGNPSPSTATATYNPQQQQEGVQLAGSLRGAGASREQSPSLIDLVDVWVAEPSSARCPKHVGVLEPEPCGGCADWRKAHQAEHDRQDAERRRAGREKREAIEACGICDRTGYLLPEHKPGWVDTAVSCSHDDAMEQVIEDLHAQEPEPERESRPPSSGSQRAAAALAMLRGGNDA